MTEVLAPYFDAELLKTVRWTIGTGRIDLGTFLTERYMDEGAVALNRQVVFSSERLTENVWIWAHELAHVEQYRRMGINRFAAAYISDWQAIEREATDRANAVTAAIRKAG
ncbi:eCIS core domain-containing protein [Blastomonas aquatica]